MKALPFALVLLLFAVACGGGGSSASPTATAPSYTATRTPQASRLVDWETFSQITALAANWPGVLGHVVSTEYDAAENRIVLTVDSDEARAAANREIETLDLAPGSVHVAVGAFPEED